MQNKLRGVNVFGKITSLDAIVATSSFSGASLTVTSALTGATLSASSSAVCGSLKVGSAQVASSSSTLIDLPNTLRIGESARSTQIGTALIHISTTGALEWYSTAAGAWKVASTA